MMDAPLENSINHNVVQKATLLSENIVKILMMEESYSTLLSTNERDTDKCCDASNNTLPTTASTVTSTGAGLPSSSVSPAAYLMQELDKISPEGCSPCSILALEHADLFHKCTPEQMQYYDTDVVEAIYARDIEALRFWLSQGRPLQVSNPFGDTLLHIACRRGYVDVAEFLVNEAAVSPWVHDEQGKTPLHCACHSAEPHLDLVDFLVEYDSELLFVADIRGSMPLDYAPKETWMDWISYLNEKQLWHILPHREVFFKISSKVQPITSNSALPFLEDVDRIIADYAAKKKKKKKKKSQQKQRESSTKSEDDSPETMKSMITSSILQKLDTYSNDSSSSSQIIEWLQEVTSLSPGALQKEIQKQRRMDQEIENPQDLEGPETMTDDSSLSCQSPKQRSVSSSSSDKIDLLKELQSLRIGHVRSSTALEIALEMERQVFVDMQKCRRDVKQARKERCELIGIIQQVEATSASSVGKDRIECLQHLQELKIKHVTTSTNVDIALEMERNANETLRRAQKQVQMAREECDHFAMAIRNVQDLME